MSDAPCSPVAGRRWRWAVGWLAAAMGLLPCTARAYYLSGSPWDQGSAIVLNLQLGSSPVTLFDGASTWNQVAIDAMNEWNPRLSGGVHFESDEAVLTPGHGDGQNSVFFSPTIFGEEFGGDTLAVTYRVTVQDRTVEADVIVNSAQKFDSYRGSLRKDAGNNNLYDLRRVLIHEFGHVLGLAHTGAYPPAIMAPAVSDLDTVQNDDVAGVTAIYGSLNGPPIIISALNVAAGVNRPFTYSTKTFIAATSYAADGLPDGLSINPTTGVISGTPSQPGVYVATLSAANAHGGRSVPLTITVDTVPVVTSTGDITAIVGHPFRFQITAINHPASFGFFSRPFGLTYNAYNGLITGTPTSAGQERVYYQAVNAAGQSDNYLSVTVLADDAALALHQFTAAEGPYGNGALVLGADGNLYGMNSYNGQSTIFRATPGGAVTVLHVFQAPGGVSPNGELLLAADGNFYGTTYGGGAGGQGTFFRLTPAGEYTTVHEFTADEGGHPYTGLVQGIDGSFYGIKSRPGINPTADMLYRITPDGVASVVHNFTAGEGGSRRLVAGTDGNFYGVTPFSVQNQVLYRIASDGTYSVLHDFGLFPSDNPSDTLIQGSDGSLYGLVTPSDYSGTTLYRVTLGGQYTRFSTQASFGKVRPFALSKGVDGFLYASGSYQGSNYFTAVFRFAIDGTATLIHSFPAASYETLSNSPTQGRDGALYAITGAGLLYKFAPGVLSPHPLFFEGEVPLANSVYYLQLPGGNFFGYYSFLTDPHYIYHFDMGYEYVFDAQDGTGGVYLYDFKSGTFFYTSPSFGFPYLYDFSLNTVLYYYPDPKNPGHYNTNGTRYFYRFDTGAIFSK